MSLQDFYALKKPGKARVLDLSSKDIDVLNQYAAAIIQIYQRKTDNENGAISALELGHLNPGSVEKYREKLNHIFNRIRKSREIQQYPVHSFLSVVPQYSYEFYDEWYVLQARVLIVSHHLYTLEGFEKHIINAMASSRGFLNIINKNLFVSMPSFDDELEKLVKKLKSFKNKATILDENESRIGNVLSLFLHYKSNKKVYIKRKSGRRNEGHTDPVITVYPPKFIPEEDENTVEEIAQPIFEEGSYDYEQLEREAEQSTIARLFSVNLAAPSEVKKSLAKQSILANATINHILRREKYLISDVNQLTTNEVSVLIKYCLDLNELTVEAIYILLSLVTGRSLAQIFSEDFNVTKMNKKPFNGRLVIVCKPQLPEHKQLKNTQGFISPSTGSVILSLPKKLSDAYLKRDKENDLKTIKEKVSNKISRLNDKYGCRITQARIANFLATFLQQHGTDSVETSLLLGWEPKQVAGTYYYQVSCERLLLIHQKYLVYLYQTISEKYSDFIEIKGRKDECFEDSSQLNQTDIVYVGSQLQVKSKYISKLFFKLKEHLESDCYSINEFHNLYTIYTLLLLNLATGHRPVKNPYETANIFDFNAGTMFLCDKESRSTLAARVLVLPELALKQMKKYLSHLAQISLSFSNLSPEKELQITEAIIGKSPLFFFIYNDKITPVIPKNLQEELLSIFPIALNWHRHYMRTILRKHNVSGQIVDLWMGHSGIGNTDMSKFSGLSMSDLRDVANIINTHLVDDLAIETLDGKDKYYE